MFIFVSCVAVAGDLRPSSGGESSDASLPRDGRQPVDAAALLDRSILLRSDVHRVKRAASRQVPQVHTSQAGIPLR